jgi:branched-chain amino acid transport system permease protein
MLANTIIYGFVNSVILLLVALGFNLTFGISGVANFAYGALYIMGALLCWVFLNPIGLPYFISVVLAVAVTAIAGALMYRFVLLRIRGLVLSEVIATFGIGLALLELYKYMGFIGFEYSLPVISDISIEIGAVVIDLQRVFIVIIGVTMAGFIWFFTHHTRTGLRFRGIAQEERTALSLGINTDRVAMLSVSFGGAYAAIAAIFILPLGTINVEQGYSVLINALAVCIVGGLGSTGGLVLASFLIGYGQTFTVTYLESHWVMLVPLIAILVILVIKPSGLFGKHKELEERI